MLNRSARPAPIRYNPVMRRACLLAMIALAAMAQDPPASARQSTDKFYSALRENNLTQLKALLEQKGSANVEGNRGITPLMTPPKSDRSTPCAC